MNMIGKSSKKINIYSKIFQCKYTTFKSYIQLRSIIIYVYIKYSMEEQILLLYKNLLKIYIFLSLFLIFINNIYLIFTLKKINYKNYFINKYE